MRHPVQYVAVETPDGESVDEAVRSGLFDATVVALLDRHAAHASSEPDSRSRRTT